MKTTKKIFSASFFIACLFVIASVIAGESGISFPRDKVAIQTTAGRIDYNAEIATSREQLEQGLMFRKKIAADEAMLFVFSSEQHIKMWMKNTLISLDMLFIDKQGKIIYIAENAKPNSTDAVGTEAAKSLAVLEIAGGGAKKKNIKPGDKVIYKVFAQ